MSGLSVLSDLSVMSKIVYRVSYRFPKDEIYNTTQQMKRAIVSARLNVREGNVFYDKRKITHFERALGSLVEVDECLCIAQEMNWISEEEFMETREQYYLCLNKLKKLIQSVSLLSKLKKEDG